MSSFMRRKRAEFAELLRTGNSLTDAYGLDARARAEPAAEKIATALVDATHIPEADALRIATWVITKIESELRETENQIDAPAAGDDFAARVMANEHNEEPA